MLTVIKSEFNPVGWAKSIQPGLKSNHGFYRGVTANCPAGILISGEYQNFRERN